MRQIDELFRARLKLWCATIKWPFGRSGWPPAVFPNAWAFIALTHFLSWGALPKRADDNVVMMPKGREQVLKSTWGVRKSKMSQKFKNLIHNCPYFSGVNDHLKSWLGCEHHLASNNPPFHRLQWSPHTNRICCCHLLLKLG